MNEPSLKNLIGTVIMASVPILKEPDERDDIKKFKLHGVEPAGLWLESQEITNEILDKEQLRSSPGTLVLFIPFDKINLVISALPMPSFSEKGIIR
jgi:hypothetical protein